MSNMYTNTAFISLHIISHTRILVVSTHPISIVMLYTVNIRRCILYIRHHNGHRSRYIYIYIYIYMCIYIYMHGDASYRFQYVHSYIIYTYPYPMQCYIVIMMRNTTTRTRITATTSYRNANIMRHGTYSMLSIAHATCHIAPTHITMLLNLRVIMCRQRVLLHMR